MTFNNLPSSQPMPIAVSQRTGKIIAGVAVTIFLFYYFDTQLLLFLAFVLGDYFLPAIVAKMRGHHNAMSIFLLNLFLGWTFVGWVVALVWAASALQQPPYVTE